MGSIVAVLVRSIPIDPALAEKMLAAAPHRGSELSVRICGNCLLGVSNRRDFIDSTISGQGERMAVFSGTLDNAADLSRILSEAGHKPASTNPADITVSAFKAFGADAPNRMRGEFVGAVSDGHQLYCFRDHIGFKPLFYRDDQRAFFIAMEPKQIIEGANLKREPNLEVLERIFYGQVPADMPSALQGIDRLPQATTLMADPIRTGKPRRYWHPAQLLETACIKTAELSENFTERFAQAVDRSLTGEDVISLSGGIDSPAVAAFAAPRHLERTGRAISALSMVFPDVPSVDERPYIEMVSQHLGINLHTYQIQAGVFDDLKRWCALLDGPVPTIALPEIHEYYDQAHQLGFRNVLTGELAEFLFIFRRHLLGHLLIHGRWKALSRLIATEVKQGASRKDIGRQLLTAFIPGAMAKTYLHLRGLDNPQRIPDWLDPGTVNEKAPYRSDLSEPVCYRWSALQLVAFDGCAVTMEAGDLCAGMNGVTVRRPFADVDLWEFFLSLPAEMKFPDLRSKTLVRQLLRGKLPDAILDRRDKTVFDDHIMSRIDYATLREFLVSPNHQVEGVDYERLAARIERADFKLTDWLWANDLVRIHAFLSLW
jgi:asparagine synthase (glutamine-hydrolysing)